MHCHSSRSLDEVENRCLGKTTCTIDVSNSVFGDPCWGIVKNLTVQWRCDFQRESRTGSLREVESSFFLPSSPLADQWVNLSLAEVFDRYQNDRSTVVTTTLVNCELGQGFHYSCSDSLFKPPSSLR